MTVLNKHKDTIPADAIYIGRGSIWGNPFRIGQHGTRAEVIEQHRDLLWKRVKSGDVTLEMLASLHGRDLVCFCAPLPCHGHTLEKAAAWATEQLEGRA